MDINKFGIKRLGIPVAIGDGEFVGKPNMMVKVDQVTRTMAATLIGCYHSPGGTK